MSRLYHYGGSTIISLIILLRYYYYLRKKKRKNNKNILNVLYSRFLDDIDSKRIYKVLVTDSYFQVFLNNKNENGVQTYQTKILPGLSIHSTINKLRENKIKFGIINHSNSSTKLTNFIMAFLPLIYLGMTYYMLKKLFNENDTIGKENKKNKNRNKKLILGHSDDKTTFQHVAGIDKAKKELEEIVDYLRNPKKYNEIGAKVPKGVLLYGPPGTGKTLLARAVATEAGVSFLFCSASDFVEMLVGRGAARVRDLFIRASELSPCIIFIDELDALAKARGGLNSNDEREQTLNQLLTEMDGFEGKTNGVILLAATNRKEVLDPALCRPGRFDRQVEVSLPDLMGRIAILKVHCNKIKLDPEIKANHHLLEKFYYDIAKNCENKSGAELANLVNEAALIAVRYQHKIVKRKHFDYVLNRMK